MASFKSIYIRTYVFFLTLFFSGFAFGQEPIIDSLYEVVKHIPESEDKCDAYKHLLEELVVAEPYYPEFEIYLDELSGYAQKVDSKKCDALVFCYKGYLEKSNRNFEKSIELFEKSYQSWIELENYERAHKMYQRIGQNLKKLGKFEEARKRFYQHEQLVKNIEDDFIQAKLNIEYGNFAFFDGKYKAAKQYYLTAVALYDKLGKSSDKGVALANLGSVTQDDHEAISYFKEAISLTKNDRGGKIYVQALTKLSTRYNYIGDFDAALTTVFKAIAHYDSLKNENGAGAAKVTLALIYTSMDDIEKAKEIYLEVIESARKTDDIALEITAQGNLAYIYNGANNYDKAIEYFEKVDELSKKIGKPNGYLSIMGRAYIKAGQLEKGYEIISEVLKTTENKDDKGDCYLGLGEYYLRKEEFKKAAMYVEKSIQLNKVVANTYPGYLLYQIKKKQKDYKSALEWYEKIEEIADSLMAESNIKKLTSAQLNYEFDKEKAQIAFEQEKQEALLEAKAERNLLAAGGIGALAFLGFGFFFNARRNNKKIAAQNAEISEKNNQLEQLNHTKDRIFAIIGHDLRKPVVAFSGISETINYLVKKEDYTTLQQLGAEIEKDGFALQKLTDNLLNWALTQRDVMPYNPTQVDVSQKAEEIALIFQKVARDKNIELVNAVPAGQTAFADPNALLTILVNLTDNALKYTPEGGRVEITANDSDEGLQIRVSDTGVGIAAEQLEDIFLLQKDKSQTGTDGEKGTGLGLHLVNELVKLNGGEITAQSSVGKGTTFSVSLPTKQLKAT